MSAKGRILGALSPLLLRECRVTAVEALAPELRRVDVGGDGLKGAAWIPGDKAEIVLPARDVRTYTPTRWDASLGSASFLIFSHGDGPGARWARTVARGDVVRMLAPRASLRPGPAPAVVFGDETAFGLVLALGARGVLEVSDRDAAAAFAALHPDVTAVPKDGDRHLDAAVDALLSDGRTVVLAGRARSIQGVRARLKARGRPVPRDIRPYWADGKVGLD